MLYFKNTTDAQIVRIPANGPKAGGNITLELVNVINRGQGYTLTFTPSSYVYGRLITAEDEFFHDSDDRQVYVRIPVEDTSRIYYFGAVTLPAGMPEGEYEYTAAAGGEVISCGLAYIGEPKPSVTQYDNTIQYEQYRS